LSGSRSRFGGGGQGAKPPAPSPNPPPPTPYWGLGGELEGRAGERRSPGPPLNPKLPLRLCVPVVEASMRRARGLYLRAARRGFWAEVRLDYLESPDLRRLFRTLPGTVIVTNRRPEEGGRWAGSEAARLRLLEEALDLGVHYVDVELATDPGWRRDLVTRRGGTGVILSWHDVSGTPDPAVLEKVLEEMLAAEADILKIVGPGPGWRPRFWEAI